MDWKDMITWGLLLYIAAKEYETGGGCGCGGGCDTTLTQGSIPPWLQMGPLAPIMGDFTT